LPDEASADTCDRLARRAIYAWRACGNCPSGRKVRERSAASTAESARIDSEIGASLLHCKRPHISSATNDGRLGIFETRRGLRKCLLIGVDQKRPAVGQSDASPKRTLVGGSFGDSTGPSPPQSESCPSSNALANGSCSSVPVENFGDPRFARFQRLSISVGLFSSEFSAKAASPACQEDRQRW